MTSPHNATPEGIAAAERAAAAMTLRRSGATYPEIARQLGYADPSGAYRAVQRGLTETLQEPADELRAVELDRLDRMQMAHWSRALAGDVKATQMVLRIMERRARLAGLDRPAIDDIEDWIREQMRREGLDADQAVSDAQRLVRDHSRDWGVR